VTIIEGLLGEHGAIYPLLQLIEESAESDTLEELKLRTSCLRATLGTHARIEDDILRPVILDLLPKPPEGPTDHEIIEAGLMEVLQADDLAVARRALLGAIAKTRQHFQVEETVIFGLVNRGLPDTTRRDLAIEWAKARGVTLA